MSGVDSLITGDQVAHVGEAIHYHNYSIEGILDWQSSDEFHGDFLAKPFRDEEVLEISTGSVTDWFSLLTSEAVMWILLASEASRTDGRLVGKFLLVLGALQKACHGVG